MTARKRPPYAVLAGYYDEVYGLWRELLSPARDEILRGSRSPFESVLDVGCGSGWQSLELARRGCRVVAVDPVAAFLRPLRQAARTGRLPIEVRRGAALSPPPNRRSVRPRPRDVRRPEPPREPRRARAGVRRGREGAPAGRPLPLRPQHAGDDRSLPRPPQGHVARRRRALRREGLFRPGNRRRDRHA
ncbi:MAG: methyltransferase domain-containing protein [Holophagales bacterium]|nr:methyltransferase domain-containing protein [Holophagales bacterium]